MTENSDYFFWIVKDIYPNFSKPSIVDADIWADMLENYSKTDIFKALKDYRQSEYGVFAPCPSQFKEFIYVYRKDKQVHEEPFCLPSYLMEEDIKANRCKHNFTIYQWAVNYVLEVKLKEVLGEEEFKKYPTYGTRYKKAIEECLFADFDKTLEIVAKKWWKK